jgi:DNA-binding FrmR family transcriptional regulator
MASKLKAAAGSFERMLLPRLNSIDGELKAINTRIDAVHGSIDGGLKAINTRIDGVHGRIDGVEKSVDSLRNELKAEIRMVATAQDAKIDNVLLKVDQIDKKLDIDRRMTVMEAKMKELEKRS